MCLCTQVRTSLDGITGVCQTRTPAVDLQYSQGIQHLALRALRCNRRNVWQVGSWNVRSIVDTEGSIAIASRRQDSHRGEERNVDLIVREMRRYDMKVVGLQETKWLGCDVYDVAGSVVFTAGRAVPDSNDSFQRGEGVALVLFGWAIDAWKAGGQQWKA